MGGRRGTGPRTRLHLDVDATITIDHSDNKYVLNGITNWIHGWKRHGWRTSARQPVKNAD